MYFSSESVACISYRLLNFMFKFLYTRLICCMPTAKYMKVFSNAFSFLQLNRLFDFEI